MPVGSGTTLGWGALLGFGEETVLGTRVTATSFMEFRSESFAKTIEEEKLESLGTGRASARRVQKGVDVKGSLTYDFHPMDGIKILKQALMGTVTSGQIATTGAFNHTMTVGDLSGITQKGLSFEIKKSSDTTTAFMFYGCRVNTFKLSAAIGQPIKTDVSFIGYDGTTGAFATTTATYSPIRPFLFMDGTFLIDGTPASLTSTSSENIISFELQINNNLQADASARSLGTALLTALPPGRREVSLKITQRFDTTTAWDRFRLGTAASIRLRFITDVTISNAATTYSCLIDLNKVYYNSAVPMVSGPGILTHDVDISSISDTVTSAGTDMTVSLTNTTTSYA